VTVPSLATNGSADGQHTVSVEEQDAAGNISQATGLTFTLDTIAPALQITSESSNGGSGKVTLAGTSDTAGSIQISDGTTVIGPASISGGTWSFTTAKLSDAVHTFTVTETRPSRKQRNEQSRNFRKLSPRRA
jgi:hypothetical protein